MLTTNVLNDILGLYIILVLVLVVLVPKPNRFAPESCLKPSTVKTGTLASP